MERAPSLGKGDFGGSDEATSSDVSDLHTGAWDSAWLASCSSRGWCAAVYHPGLPLVGLGKLVNPGADDLQCTLRKATGCRRATASTKIS